MEQEEIGTFMNLGIIRAKLVEIHNSNTPKHGIEQLIKQIDREIEVDKERNDLAAVSSIIDDYGKTLNILEMDFLAISGTNMQDVSKKVHNLNEQLCILSLINTYLASIKMTEPSTDYRLAKYYKMLLERKESYKSLAIQKTSCLKSLYTEQERNTKALEYKIYQADFNKTLSTSIKSEDNEQ